MSDSTPSESGSGIGAVFDVLAGWLAPSRQARRVTVPDFRGMHVSDVWFAALQARVRVKIVRLTLDPVAADGWVEGQDPAPGTEVRRGKAITLLVRHPRADRPRRRRN